MQTNCQANSEMSTQDLLLLINRYATLCESLHNDPRLEGQEPLRDWPGFKESYLQLLKLRASLETQLSKSFE